MKEVQIEKLDNQGRGICHFNNKITFVNKVLPEEQVDIKLTKVKKKYNEAIVEKIKKKSPLRIESPCPYFSICGGCDLLHMSYEDTLKYKKENLQSIIKKYAKIEREINIISSKEPLSYRNKITLKIKNGSYGYYEEETHNLIKIENCLLAEKPIQKIIKDIPFLHIKDGEVVIRSNYNQEILLWIKTKEEISPAIDYLKKNHKIVGIVVNEKCIYGESHLIERINNLLFKVSYDSFFQINRDICTKIFAKIREQMKEEEIILDLYCGVGTLGIVSSKKAKKVYGIEIVKNAVLNAITNAKINNCRDNYYLLGEVENTLPKINDKIDTVIVDPPRAGLDKKTVERMNLDKPKKIIYVSCNPMTLARDLLALSVSYTIEEIEAYDMFPFTHHVESICILKRK